MYVTNVVPSGNRFLGEVVAASHDCAVFARARFTSDGSDFAIVVDDHDIESRNGISPYGERYAPGLSQQGIAPRATCPDIGGGPGAQRAMTRLAAEPLRVR